MLTKNLERALAAIAFLICVIPFISLAIKLQTSSLIFALDRLDFSPFTLPRIVLALIFLKEIVRPQTVARFKKNNILFALLALAAYGLIVFNLIESGGPFFSKDRFAATFPNSLFFDIAIIPLLASVYFSLTSSGQIALSLGAYAFLGLVVGGTLTVLGESAFIYRDYAAEVTTLILFFRWFAENRFWKNFIGYVLLFFVLLVIGGTIFQKIGAEDPGKNAMVKQEFDPCYPLVQADKLECFKKLGRKYQDVRIGELIGDEESKNAYLSGVKESGSY